MVDMKLHQQKVYDCLQSINEEVRKIRKGKNKITPRVVDTVISNNAKKLGLKVKNIKIIYYGKREI